MSRPIPCPICGGKPTVETVKNVGGFAANVRCEFPPGMAGIGHSVFAYSSCTCETRAEARKEAINEWNRRAGEDKK